ncbi:hypothetical protein [Usitatibacter palustris]|uniref:DUF1579 domain-containing protein n=1 Tax=Usitatibacter palustris TaxID=2732487 RepID=A0A6M4H6X0_9PROT|nr:hypothetical protein [Usitatibacter palustris]QJR15122.1 hypothetical protein DSM104440_01939 [Usitatibacter palustris]
MSLETLRNAGAALITAAIATASPALAQAPSAEKPGRGDFDFLVGRWKTEQKRNTTPLKDDGAWESFTAEIHMQKFPGGIGNFDVLNAPTWRPGYTGLAIRIFNGETGLWSIYWLNNKTGGIDKDTNELQVPVVGKFVNGVGIFENDEVFQGTPIRVQYRWDRVDADNVKWQQAFSFDGGKTWKVNWHMTGTRIKS